MDEEGTENRGEVRVEMGEGVRRRQRRMDMQGHHHIYIYHTHTHIHTHSLTSNRLTLNNVIRVTP